MLSFALVYKDIIYKNIALMMSNLLTIAVAFGALILAFLLINIRKIFVGEDFRGTCAQNNPLLKNQIGECTVCGRKPEEECQLPEVEET
ncbi:membrane or secreted protein [Saprospira grandis str. Lewin]|uniref:Membrane or secreted protein n=2 Tax=Saprospira TaxID=1007 RepID=H6L9K2_SAPGL|nr:membrane or secreted protein [Saprospira grandis str. Lewin]